MEENKKNFNHIHRLLKRLECNYSIITFFSNKITLKGNLSKLDIEYSAYFDSILVSKTDGGFSKTEIDSPISKILNLINSYYSIYKDYDINDYFDLMIKCKLI